MTETIQATKQAPEEPPHSSFQRIEARSALEKLWERAWPHGRKYILAFFGMSIVPLALVGVLSGAPSTAASDSVVPIPVPTTPVSEPIPPQSKPVSTPIITKSFKAYVTQYSRADSCHNIRGGKCVMASGKEVYVGAVACPYFLSLGAKVQIDQATFTCEDRYAPWLDTMRGMPTVDVFVDNNPHGRDLKEIDVLKQ